MNRDEPGGDQVNKMMEEVSVCDAIDGGVGGKKEKEDIGDVSNTT